MLVFGLVSASDEKLGVSIRNFEERGNLAFECFGIADIVGNLDIEGVSLFFGDKIDFSASECANVNLVASAQEFNGDNVLVSGAIVHVFGAELGIAKSMVAKVVFVSGIEVSFAFDVIALLLLVSKRAEFSALVMMRAVVRLPMLSRRKSPILRRTRAFWMLCFCSMSRRIIVS